ncbi:MAG: alpha/beta hydrolase [Chloroflexia bacterium]|nr:alpha/beta hydrolase [Chloroflexia bacterium]
MTVVLVHGIPETPEVWDLLAARLAEAGHKDQIRLSPPGFGAAVPNGFGATVFEYRDWLIAELERIAGPVNLVGHDLGGGLTMIVAMARPGLIQSWCSDAIGLFDPDYVWHESAQLWQTPGAGEAFVARAVEQSVEERAEPLTSRGMDPVIAARVSAGFDARMGESILRMYRSAVQPVMAELGADLEAAAARPGLVIIPTEDQAVGTDEQRRRSAARAAARVEVLPGFGHWWMTEDEGRRGAAALDAFWASFANGKASK